MQTIDAARVRERLAAAGLAAPDELPAVLAEFLQLLERWNRVHNLTAIADADELIDRHLIESLALAPLLAGRTIADVGSGAGLPGLPLALAEPGREFTLIESRAKRVGFLRHVVGELGLGNVGVSHGRVEDLRFEQPFGTVLARAVAPLARLIVMTRHLGAPGSRLVVVTGASGERLPPPSGYRSRAVGAEVTGLVRGSVVCLERNGD